jgi:hypothetical protein
MRKTLILVLLAAACGHMDHQPETAAEPQPRPCRNVTSEWLCGAATTEAQRGEAATKSSEHGKSKSKAGLGLGLGNGDQSLCRSITRKQELFDHPEAADRRYAMKRDGSSDPRHAYAEARQRMESMPRYSTVADRIAGGPRQRIGVETTSSDTPIGTWTFLGPGNIGGRTRALLIDPTNPGVMIAGAVSGGVWKTVDGGNLWFPVGDLLANLDVSSLAFDPNDSQVIYAGTGEGYFREDVRGTGLPLRGNGIFVTRNGGQSWEQLASTTDEDFQWVNDVAVSAHDSRRLYAATRTGVWRSSDAGATWTLAVPATVKGGCLDLAYRKGTDGDFIFASCGVFDQATVYRSMHAEADAAWTAVLSEPGMSRTSLAIAPSNPSIVYALAAGPDQSLLGVYRSDQNGDPGTWSARVTGTNTIPLNTMLLTNAVGPLCDHSSSKITMGWHSNVIAVDPLDPERVWAAGVDLFRSDDGGRNWGIASYWWAPDDTPGYVHADQHAIVFHPGYDGSANKALFVTNDGGVFRTADARAGVALGANAACHASNTLMSWTPLNHHFGATQFYHGAALPDGRTFLGGAQDNGTVIGTIGGGIDQWQLQNGGDGGYVAFDPSNPRVLYAESQYASIVKSIDGGFSFADSTKGLIDDFLFVTPFVVDPNVHDRLWTGGRRMWRLDSGKSAWTAIPAPFNGQVSAIAVAPGRPDRVFAGTNAGEIVRSDNATTAAGAVTWSSIAPRAGYVSSLTFDPSNVDIVYATYAGFGGGPHVWRSIDGGATWTPLDGAGQGALPDIPMHSLAVDPNRPSRLFLGTDLGIFVSLDGGAHWFVENSGFAAVITETVFIGQGARGPAVYAFTHGRGVWRAELTTPPRRRAR